MLRSGESSANDSSPMERIGMMKPGDPPEAPERRRSGIADVPTFVASDYLSPVERRRGTPCGYPSLKLPIPDDRRGTPCGCPAGSHRSPAESPLHVAIPGARKDANPSRRLESRRSTHPGSVVPKQWPADGGAVRGRATTRVAPTSRSTAATRWAPLTDNPRPVSRGIMPEARRWGTSVSTAETVPKTRRTSSLPASARRCRTSWEPAGGVWRARNIPGRRGRRGR